ncbi:MAG: hypothetical protein HQM09_19370 [Candidatus Riflebacteria bacterium]|nr:hypothetical protein [Candidatus Riflebacteria bacterium]
MIIKYGLKKKAFKCKVDLLDHYKNIVASIKFAYPDALDIIVESDYFSFVLSREPDLREAQKMGKKLCRLDPALNSIKDTYRSEWCENGKSTQLLKRIHE